MLSYYICTYIKNIAIFKVTLSRMLNCIVNAKWICVYSHTALHFAHLGRISPNWIFIKLNMPNQPDLFICSSERPSPPKTLWLKQLACYFWKCSHVCMCFHLRKPLLNQSWNLLQQLVLLSEHYTSSEYSSGVCMSFKTT